MSCDLILDVLDVLVAATAPDQIPCPEAVPRPLREVRVELVHVGVQHGRDEDGVAEHELSEHLYMTSAVGGGAKSR